MESLIYLLKSTAILSLFFLVYEVFLKQETHYTANRKFLLTGIFIAGILPYLTIEEITFITKTVESSSAKEVIATNLSASKTVATLPQQPGFWESLNYWQLFIALYLIITSFFVIKFLFSLWQLRRFLNKQENYYFKNGIKYIQTNEITGAYSIFKNIVYNPSLHGASELDLILKHEEAHVQNHHSIDMLLGNLLVFLNWFNPLAWLYRKRISQNLEFLADRAATEDLNSPKAYQLSLLNYVQVESSAFPVNNFQKSFIKTRIKKLQQMKSKKFASLKIGLILPLLTIFYFAFQIDSRAEIIYVEQKSSKITPDSTTSNALISSQKIQVQDSSESKVRNKTKIGTTSKSAASNLDDVHSQKKNEINSVTGFVKHNKETSIAEKSNSVQVLIQKNTTEKSLQEIKQLLKKENQIAFDYSNLKFDAEDNLTQIEMNFTDNKGKDYHYVILGDKPIPEIQLIVSEEFTGFKTFATDDYSIDRKSAIIINGKPDSDIEKVLEEVLFVAQNKTKKANQSDKESTKEKSKTSSLIKSVNVIKNKGGGLILINDQEKTTKKTAQKNIFAIDKHTTDQDLEEIKKYFTDQNIDFSYRVAQRNKNGEITKIKIKVKDGKGKNSSTAYQNNQGIDSFKVGLKEGEFFIH